MALLAFDREVKSQLRPILKKAGFTRFEGRTAWRHTNEHVDVIALNAVTGDDALGIAPAVEFFTVIGTYDLRFKQKCGGTIRRSGDRPMPHYYDCHFNTAGCRLYDNRVRNGTIVDRWRIDADASNAASRVRIASEFAVIDGLAWLASHRDTQNNICCIGRPPERL